MLAPATLSYAYMGQATWPSLAESESNYHKSEDKTPNSMKF